MEFERALFRIHQRALESEDFLIVRHRAERVLPWAFAAFAALLAISHCSYVGRARCLPDALQQAGLWNATRGAAELPEDALLGVTVLAIGGVHQEMHQGDAFAAAFEGPAATLTAAGQAKKHAQEVAAQYTFTLEREVLALKPRLLGKHGFQIHNVSVSQECLSGPGTLGALFRLMEGYDGLVVNELAYALRSRGHLLRHDGGSLEGDAWAWTAAQVEAPAPLAGRPLLASFTRKALLLLKAFFAWALMSAITGLFIRVAVSGSAVMMYAAAIAARELERMDIHCGGGAISMQLLGRSFPWIGVYTGILGGAGQPLWPLLRAHLGFLLVQSFAYLSCSLGWRLAVFRKLSPQGYADQLFGLCSIVELFNLVFVRAPGSAVAFPKVAGASLVYLQFYTLCSFYPCHGLALSTCTLACAWAMVYCLNHFEDRALQGDPFNHNTPTAAHPRALYLPQLSPSWSLEAAPLWTMFWPPEPPSSYPQEAMRRISDEEYIAA